MSHPKYWAARHSSKLDDVEQIFSIAEKLVKGIDEPPEGISPASEFFRVRPSPSRGTCVDAYPNPRMWPCFFHTSHSMVWEVESKAENSACHQTL